MSTESESHDKIEHQAPDMVEHKIHKTHFQVLKTPLRSDNFDSGYEWKDMGNGHFKRVPKKTENDGKIKK